MNEMTQEFENTPSSASMYVSGEDLLNAMKSFNARTSPQSTNEHPFELLNRGPFVRPTADSSSESEAKHDTKVGYMIHAMAAWLPAQSSSDTTIRASETTGWDGNFSTSVHNRMPGSTE